MSKTQTVMLREAAKRIRAAIGDPNTMQLDEPDFVIPGPWSYARVPDGGRVAGRFEVTPDLDETYVSPAMTEYEEDARYIAMMDPVTGAALAVLLDAAADASVISDDTAEGRSLFYAAVEVAHAILG